MNSPDPGSPTSTDSNSSGSPPPDDFQLSSQPVQMMSGGPAGPSSSKRRLHDGGAPRRDPKSRRREDAMGGPASRFKEGHGMRKDKEELVDTGLAEQLKKEFGDPFQEAHIKSLS
ncbi:hypothetical protein CONPUDRAFT_89975 [Coniophora puteana RWD-64-598 SS2]|uniref:Uncharacterized protein n=1 Tax=Coniophora puteana (strain RWD-64-598) TaxID=741705 RepID=A0A5M3MP01_CONPW|nr:uncharacterized protein CONPUDRAFT_89975 [Coniophora puteana RWD-64-598 SS2]EIW80898.1 hypothetical protein CONPUDRAFT_89975 [Coniophora puteana RWD-64-598 SS2]